MNHFSFILERLSSRAKNALITSQRISEDWRHDHIGTEHLLFGIVEEKASFASEILLKNRVSAETIKHEIVRMNENHTSDKWQPKLSNNLREVIEKAAIVAHKYQYQFIGTEHFLYGICDMDSDEAKSILLGFKVSVNELRKNLLAIFENVSRFPDLLNVDEQAELPPVTEKNSKTPALDYFTTDLSKKALKGKSKFVT